MLRAVFLFQQKKPKSKINKKKKIGSISNSPNSKDKEVAKIKNMLAEEISLKVIQSEDSVDDKVKELK